MSEEQFRSALNGFRMGDQRATPASGAATDGATPPTAPDEFREVFVGGHLMFENEYEAFKKAVRDSGPIYDSDPIFRVVAEIIEKRVQELF